MQIRREEITTGLLVILTIGAIVAVLIALGAPGVFAPIQTYYIHFDNAGGIKQGGPVHLAGRKVGQVTKLFSPVPLKQRPEEHKDYEALVEIRVSEDAEIYRDVSTTLQQFGLLGEYTIDFTSGVETSGRAPEGYHFVGVRAPSINEFMAETLKTIKPVAEEAKQTLEQLRTTSVNLSRLTGEDSDFDKSMASMRELGANLAKLSNEQGPLWDAIEKFKGLTTDLKLISADLVEKDTINLTLGSFRETSAQLQAATTNLNDAVSGIAPDLSATARNASQLTDTLKRQPWRLLWPTTKKYPEDKADYMEDGVPVRRAMPVR